MSGNTYLTQRIAVPALDARRETYAKTLEAGAQHNWSVAAGNKTLAARVRAGDFDRHVTSEEHLNAAREATQPFEHPVLLNGNPFTQADRDYFE